MELRDYVRFLRQYWRTIVLATLLTAGLSLAYSYTLSPPPAYEATTRLYVSASSDHDMNVIGLPTVQLVQVVQSYAEIVKGDEVSRRVIQRLDLSTTPRELASQISASAVTDTTILQITVVDPSADRAQLLANAVAKEFIAFVREVETPPGKTAANIKAVVIDKAATPTGPAGAPGYVRNGVVGLVLGSIIGFGLAVVRESLRAEDAE